MAAETSSTSLRSLLAIPEVGRTLAASLLGRLPYTAIGLLLILHVREIGGDYARAGSSRAPSPWASPACRRSSAGSSTCAASGRCSCPAARDARCRWSRSRSCPTALAVPSWPRSPCSRGSCIRRSAAPPARSGRTSSRAAAPLGLRGRVGRRRAHVHRRPAPAGRRGRRRLVRRRPDRPARPCSSAGRPPSRPRPRRGAGARPAPRAAGGRAREPGPPDPAGRRDVHGRVVRGDRDRRRRRIAEEHGDRALVGPLLAAWAAGSLIGGLPSRADGPRPTPTAGSSGCWPRRPSRTAWWRLRRPCRSWLALFLAGACIAPAFATLYAMVADLAREGTLTESYTWLTTGIAAGIAAGSAVGGALIDGVSTHAAMGAAPAWSCWPPSSPPPAGGGSPCRRPPDRTDELRRSGGSYPRDVPHRSRSAMTSDSALAIEATGLVKTFGETRAVDGVDLAVRAGSVYGVLGPNGAGKTTTIRMLATLLTARRRHGPRARPRHRARGRRRARPGQPHRPARVGRRGPERPGEPGAARPPARAPPRPARARRATCCSRRSASPTPPRARSRPTRAACAGGSTSPPASSSRRD